MEYFHSNCLNMMVIMTLEALIKVFFYSFPQEKGKNANDFKNIYVFQVINIKPMSMSRISF